MSSSHLPHSHHCPVLALSSSQFVLVDAWNLSTPRCSGRGIATSSSPWMYSQKLCHKNKINSNNISMISPFCLLPASFKAVAVRSMLSYSYPRWRQERLKRFYPPSHLAGPLFTFFPVHSSVCVCVRSACSIKLPGWLLRLQASLLH